MRFSGWIAAAGLLVWSGQSHAQRLGLLDAMNIASSEVGGGQVTEIAADSQDGRSVWEVEVVRDGRESEVVIDANSGKVIEIERKGKVSRSKQRRINEARVSVDQALEQALAESGGGSVRKMDLDQERGKTVYEFDIETDGRMVEVDVDAQHGYMSRAEQPDLGFWSGYRGSDRDGYRYRDSDYYGYREYPRERRFHSDEPRTRYYYYYDDDWDD
jgi:uncharacterized membrane protein YkoI